MAQCHLLFLTMKYKFTSHWFFWPAVFSLLQATWCFQTNHLAQHLATTPSGCKVMGVHPSNLHLFFWGKIPSHLFWPADWLFLMSTMMLPKTTMPWHHIFWMWCDGGAPLLTLIYISGSGKLTSRSSVSQVVLLPEEWLLQATTSIPQAMTMLPDTTLPLLAPHLLDAMWWGCMGVQSCLDLLFSKLALHYYFWSSSSVGFNIGKP